MFRPVAFIFGLSMLFTLSALAQKSTKSNPCQGSTQYYSVPEVAGVVYTWTVPADWIMLGGQGTDSIYVQIGCDIGDIIVTPSNDCGAGPSQSRNIIPQDTASPFIEIEASPGIEICEGNSIVFNALVTSAGATPDIRWFLNGVEVFSGNAYAPSSMNDGDQIYATVTSTSVCASNPVVSSDMLNVIVHPTPAIPVVTQSGDSLFSNYATGNQWYDINGMLIGQNNNYLVPTSNGDYYVSYTDLNGCSSNSTAFPFIISFVVDGQFTIGVYPNPTSDQTTLSFSALPPAGTLCQLVDIRGRVLQQWSINQTKSQLALDSYAPGNYQLRIMINSSVSEIKIVITD